MKDGGADQLTLGLDPLPLFGSSHRDFIASSTKAQMHVSAATEASTEL